MKYNFQNSQTEMGFTLVELLISVLLGSALLAMTFNMYFSTKKSEQLAVNVLQAQTEARNGMHLIRQAIEHAGFTTNVLSKTQKATLFAANDRFAEGQVIRIDGDNLNQRLTVRLQGDPQRALRACNGDTVQPVTAASTTETWYEFYRNENSLFCQVYINGEQNGDAVMVAEPVAGLHIRAFTTTAGTTAQTRVRTNIGLTQDIIKSVQVQLIVRSEKMIRAENATSIIKMTGMSDIALTDRYFYLNTNQYFMAQNNF